MIEKLEKKFGKYAIKNLIYYILGAYVIGYILYLVRPDWYEYIVLYPSLVMQGQVWRLVTWVCTIPQALSFFTIFMFLFYFFIGRSLEQYMGAFRYNLYILSGWFFTTMGVMIVYWISSGVNGPAGALTVFASTNYLNLTSFLAFAVIFPDTRVLFFGIIPVKMKILAWIDGIYLALQVISGLVIALASDAVVGQALQMYYGYPPSQLEIAVMKQSSISLIITILISMLNFALFFLANAKKRAENRRRRAEFQQRMAQGSQSGQPSGRTAQGPAWFNRTERPDTGTASQTDASAGTSGAEGSGRRYHADRSGELVHRCDVCGRTNITNPELMFRFCSRCAGNHEYCQDHLFTHEHIK